jgi:hypothetical protein
MEYEDLQVLQLTYLQTMRPLPSATIIQSNYNQHFKLNTGGLYSHIPDDTPKGVKIRFQSVWFAPMIEALQFAQASWSDQMCAFSNRLGFGTDIYR